MIRDRELIRNVGARLQRGVPAFDVILVRICFLLLLAMLHAMPSNRASASKPSITVEIQVDQNHRKSLVRFSLPLPRGFLTDRSTLIAHAGPNVIHPAVRPLTWYPAEIGKSRSVRCAIVTFPYAFLSDDTVRFRFETAAKAQHPRLPLPVATEADSDGVTIHYPDGTTLRATLIAPRRSSSALPRTEIVEENAYYRWVRVHVPDDKWPRIIEMRADALGRVALIGHVQSNEPGYGRAPDLGWEIETKCASAQLERGGVKRPIGSLKIDEPCAEASQIGLQWFSPNSQQLYTVDHPLHPLYRRGAVSGTVTDGRLHYRYMRCLEAEHVPMQQSSWRRADISFLPPGTEMYSSTLRQNSRVEIGWRFWDALYATGPPLDDITSRFRDGYSLLAYHGDATVYSMVIGDDGGNFTGYSDGSKEAGPMGMNRLNHNTAAFAEGLSIPIAWYNLITERALLWCDNFYDLSIWWGPKETGGTRYNNLAAMGQTPPSSNPPFMWRSNSAVSFCTKGFDNFFIAYEQTGDPRYMEALNAQVGYASKYMTAGANYTRNVGCVRDFCNLYRWTGEKKYLDQALRLFRELRTQLSTGDLFTESGKPIEANPPFIENDAQGYQHPFAKPYILGYALEGLPDLLRLCPKEPKLREVVEAVAAFMVKSQDPVGGWRYPHPRSSSVIMSQAMEHAWQIVQADAVLSKDSRQSVVGSRQSAVGSRKSSGAATQRPNDPTTHEARLDAIERVLRQRVQGWMATGRIWSGITGWEMATGKVKKQEEIPALYAHPEDRDFRRDYTEGRADFGSSPPEGIVYFPEVLRYYLKFRPASRLLAPPKSDEPLGLLLKRVPKPK